MSSMLSRRKARMDKLTEGGTSLTVQALRRLSRSPVAVVGAAIVFVFVVVALLAPWLAPKDPYQRYLIDEVRLGVGVIPGPRPGFPLGVDDNGRDLLSRLIVGSQQTLLVGVLATLIGLAIGMMIGIVAGALGGWVETALMRLTDILLSFPGLLLAISIAALARKSSQWTVIIAVAVVSVPIFGRLLRGSMLAQRNSDHVLAATALGVRRSTIVFRHMLPNAMGPVIVQATITLAVSIIDAAALSFLGLGDPDPSRAEWGLMLGNSQRFLDLKPELAFYPAVAIVVVALGFTLLGESMRQVLDPKNRR